MKFNRFLPFATPSQLLVCETDGFSLRAAVLRRSDQDMELLYQAKTEQVDMAEGLGDVLAALKNQGWQGGGSAILLSPAVFSTLVELPVNPRKPRPLLQMLELARWEAEPLLLQHVTRWSVGHLLVGQGYMTEEQARAVMDLQQGKSRAGGGLALAEQFSLRRFGDLAVELGYIKRSQLNACLTGQEWLKAADEAIEVGWAAQSAVEDIPGTFNWLISCVHQSLLQRWSDAFARQGLKLRTMYPLTGCSAALLPATETHAVLLETQPGLGFSTRIAGSGFTALRHYLNLHKAPLDICLESYHALHAPPREPVWLASWPPAPELAADLEHMLELELHPLTHAVVGDKVSPGMAGAAYHALGLAEDERCVGVRLGGPLPALRDRLEVRAAALVLVLLVLVGVAELSLWVRRSSVDSYKQQVDNSWQSIDEAIKRITARTAEIGQIKDKIKGLRTEQLRLENLARFYDEDIPERMDLVKGVLGMLQTLVDNEVVIERLDEPDKSALKPAGNPAANPTLPPNPINDKRIEAENLVLEAWALSDSAAQMFIKRVGDAAARWDLHVREPKVTFGKGPLNNNGFSISLRLVKLAEPDGKIIRLSNPNPHETTPFE
ncbi:hypothetical protein A1353_24500 [Methylomonas methanica]|uniref:Uncharacterized protein n=1 Tax=Methylomonas methanica TaxID=421 RepID=A0A177MV80_METMH|nr:hypothetical protein [Methylomonas methanica]OAI09334.1 hypothetical protein A1353_24500 [Methylomonas methanica]